MELGFLHLECKATAEMQADAFTTFMQANTLQRQRTLMGCVPGAEGVHCAPEGAGAAKGTR